MNIIKRWDDCLDQISYYLLAISLILIVSLSALSIFGRFVAWSLLWIPPFVRHLVFLCAFLGASLATSQNKHIRIDVFSSFFEKKKKLQKFLNVFVHMICFGVLVWLLVASYNFWLMEKEYAKEVVGIIQNYHLVAIIPIGFALLALRFFNQIFLSWSQK